MTEQANLKLDKLIEELKGKHTYNGTRIVRRIVKLGEIAIDPLIECFKDDEYDPFLIIDGLVQLGEKALPKIINALKDENSSVRYWCAIALKRFSGEQVFDALVQTLQIESDQIVTIGILGTLGELGDKRALSVLTERLDATNETVCCKAIEAFGKLGDLHAVEILLPFLEKTWVVKNEAIKSLGLIGGEQALEVLLRLIETETDYSSRKAIIWSLRHFEDARVMQALIKVLGTESDELLKYLSIEILGKIGDKRALEILTDIRESANWVFIDRDEFQYPAKDAAAEAILKIKEKNGLPLE
jgi:HEAT repeat protein